VTSVHHRSDLLSTFLFSEIFCPVPMFQHGSASKVQGVVYEMTITLTCDTGFGVNGSSTETKTLKCESDRKFTPFVSCMGMLQYLL
jgi:hypothetical protein